MSAQQNSLGMMQGFIEVEHRVPLDARVLHPAYCQNCGKLMFVEKRQKYCVPCGTRYLLPLDLTIYLETAAPAHVDLGRDLPHYDGSMLQ